MARLPAWLADGFAYSKYQHITILERSFAKYFSHFSRAFWQIATSFRLQRSIESSNLQAICKLRFAHCERGISRYYK
jgi:hypothetical protein